MSNKFKADKSQTLVLLSDIIDNPYQARVAYDSESLSALADSILEVGLLQIPLARKVNDKYQLAFGHCRKRAFDILYSKGMKGFAYMPLYVLDMADREIFEIALTENFRRRQLSPIEKAKVLKRYIDEFKATSQQASKLFGISDSTVRGMVRFLDLPDEDQKKMIKGKLTHTQAKVILQRPETRQRKIETIAKIEAGEIKFDLREQLVTLFYGGPRKDVTDQMLYKRISNEHQENQSMRIQIDIFNQQRRMNAKKPAASRGTSMEKSS